jgi:hypothetical protein
VYGHCSCNVRDDDVLSNCYVLIGWVPKARTCSIRPRQELHVVQSGSPFDQVCFAFGKENQSWWIAEQLSHVDWRVSFHASTSAIFNILTINRRGA